MQTWTEEEIRNLILYAKQMQEDNEDLRAGIIAIQAKLDNEEAKVKHLKIRLLQLETHIIQRIKDSQM